MITRVPTLAAWLLAWSASLVGCSTPPPDASARAGPAIQLTATLVSPTDITLEWTDREPGAAGRIVEFATEPNGRYTILQFLPPGQTTFTHADLIPQTPFYYRVRSFHGPASRPVQLRLPKGPLDRAAEKNDHDWASPRVIPGRPAVQRPIRDPRTARSAAPAEVKATVMHANGIKFDWTDRASDEAGYLLEIKPAGHADFGVAAVLDPDINSFGLITLPTEKTAAFRIRAFYYGTPSNLVHLTTGPEGGAAEASTAPAAPK